MIRNLIIAITLVTFINITAQDMRRNSFRSLFSDEKANRVGDAITIIVMEESQASKDAQTSSGRSSGLGIGASGGMGTSTIPNVDGDISTKNEFKGSGGTRTSGMIKTKISATIDSVLNNGNMLIKGSRKISINGEQETVYIKGIVRASDIGADNSVMSYNISEAEIIFEGSGIIDDAQSPGWLTKLFHWIF